jgi:hypothetical protein
MLSSNPGLSQTHVLSSPEFLRFTQRCILGCVGAWLDECFVPGRMHSSWRLRSVKNAFFLETRFFKTPGTIHKETQRHFPENRNPSSFWVFRKVGSSVRQSYTIRAWAAYESTYEPRTFSFSFFLTEPIHKLSSYRTDKTPSPLQKPNTGSSKKMDGILNRYNLKNTGRIYTFGALKCSEKFKVSLCKTELLPIPVALWLTF